MTTTTTARGKSVVFIILTHALLAKTLRQIYIYITA